MSIGARFLEIRKAKGLKQTDVAEAIGISHGALVNYERGVSLLPRPSSPSARFIASAQTGF
jgi:transcriptional regulator with XRE-family HTH domain